jgi:hypothetical protein
MKRTLVFLVVLANMCVATLVAHAEASDDGGCSNASLQGTYGFHEQGTIFAQGLQGGVGVATFDGEGHYFVSGTFVNQTTGVHRATGTGTYAVNPDCTGSLVADNDPTATQDFVIVDGGNEYFQIATRSDRVVIWVLKKLSPRHHDEEKD